jgi:hypothetical protein
MSPFVHENTFSNNQAHKKEQPEARNNKAALRQILPGANITDGLAVPGEEVQNPGPDVDSWLRRTGLRST